MKQKFLTLFVCLFTVNFMYSQQLKTISLDMKPGKEAYLSIKSKKAFSETDLPEHKQEIDLALILTKEDAGFRVEWYNMSGKDEKIPVAYRGTATDICAISFDKQQFDKCKTVQDLKRMTEHLTNNSYSHFAGLSDGNSCAVNNHCFVVKMENGKKALLWVESSVECSFKVIVKSEQ